MKKIILFVIIFKSIIKLWSWWIKLVKLPHIPPIKNYTSSSFQHNNQLNNLLLLLILSFKCHYPPTNIFPFYSIVLDGSNLHLHYTEKSSLKYVDCIEPQVDKHQESFTISSFKGSLVKQLTNSLWIVWSNFWNKVKNTKISWQHFDKITLINCVPLKYTISTWKICSICAVNLSSTESIFSKFW